MLKSTSTHSYLSSLSIEWSWTRDKLRDFSNQSGLAAFLAVASCWQVIAAPLLSGVFAFPKGAGRYQGHLRWGSGDPSSIPIQFLFYINFAISSCSTMQSSSAFLNYNVVPFFPPLSGVRSGPYHY